MPDQNQQPAGASSAQRDGWVSVESALPDTWRDVLAYAPNCSDGDYVVASYRVYQPHKDGYVHEPEWVRGKHEVETHGVTHWMELPDKPNPKLQ